MDLGRCFKGKRGNGLMWLESERKKEVVLCGIGLVKRAARSEVVLGAVLKKKRKKKKKRWRRAACMREMKIEGVQLERRKEMVRWSIGAGEKEGDGGGEERAAILAGEEEEGKQRQLVSGLERKEKERRGDPSFKFFHKSEK